MISFGLVHRRSYFNKSFFTYLYPNFDSMTHQIRAKLDAVHFLEILNANLKPKIVQSFTKLLIPPFNWLIYLKSLLQN